MRPENPDDSRFRRRLWTTIAAVTITLLLLLALWHTVNVLLLIFAGVLLAVFLRGLSTWLSERTPLGERTALAVVGLALLALLGGGGWALSPLISAQLTDLGAELPRATERVLASIRDSTIGGWLLERLPPLDGNLPTPDQDLVRQAFGAFSTLTGAVANTLIIVFIGVYLAIHPRLYVSGLVRLIPLPQRPRAREVLAVIGSTLQRWLLGRAFLMTVIGVTTTLGLWLLDIPLALALGAIAALLSFIPNIGPFLSAIPAVLLGFVSSPGKALAVAALYAAIQTVESYVFEPLVEHRTVSLPPVLVITAQIIMGLALGLLGLLLATPLFAVLLVLVKMVYVEDILGDRSITVKGEDEVLDRAHEA